MRQFFKDSLIVQEIFHGLFTLPFACVLYYLTRRIDYFGGVLFLAYLIDVDHLIDYFLKYRFNFKLDKFLSGKCFEVTQRAVIPFHSWELVIILTFLVFIYSIESIFSVFLFALIPHLAFDSISVAKPGFYFFLYRASRKFKFYW